MLINVENPYCNRVNFFETLIAAAIGGNARANGFYLVLFGFYLVNWCFLQFSGYGTIKNPEGLVFPQPYTFAIFKSGKIFLNNGPKLSAFENGRLCSANIQVTLTSASLSMFEPTATESYIICLWALLLLKKSTCFLGVRALYNVLILKKRDYSTN